MGFNVGRTRVAKFSRVWSDIRQNHMWQSALRARRFASVRRCMAGNVWRRWRVTVR